MCFDFQFANTTKATSNTGLVNVGPKTYLNENKLKLHTTYLTAYEYLDGTTSATKKAPIKS